MAKKALTIPNWTIFGTHIVSAEIHQFKGDDNKKVYQLALTFFLDDSTPLEKDEAKQKVVTIYTDKQSLVLDDLVYDAAIWLGQSFKNISNSVFVIAEDGSIAKQIELDVFMPKASKQSKTTGNATFAN